MGILSKIFGLLNFFKLKTKLVTFIIVFISITSFYAGFIYSESSEEADRLKEEYIGLLDRAEALDANYRDIADFEILEESIIVESLFNAKLLLDDIHIRLNLNESGTESYSIGLYLSNVNEVSELLKRAMKETLDTTGFIIYYDLFYLGNDFYEIETQGFFYAVTKSYWEQIENKTNKSIFIVLSPDEYLSEFYSPWDLDVRAQVLDDYDNTYNSFVKYNSLFGFYDVLKEEYIRVVALASQIENEVSKKAQLANRIANVVSVTTVVTVLTTYSGMTYDNKLNNKKISEIMAKIKEDPSLVSQPTDRVGTLILLGALIVSIGGLYYIYTLAL